MCQCHTWPRICSVCRFNNLVISSFRHLVNILFNWYNLSFLYHYQDVYWTWMYIWVIRLMSYQKQELLSLWEHPGSPPPPSWFMVLLNFFSFLRCVICFRPVSCVSNGASVSGLSILNCHLMCIQWCRCFLIVHS